MRQITKDIQLNMDGTYTLDDLLDAAELIRSFMGSSEFKGKKLSSEETVKALYRAYLYREADGTGLAMWVKKLEGGQSLDSIMNGFAGSKPGPSFSTTITLALSVRQVRVVT